MATLTADEKRALIVLQPLMINAWYAVDEEGLPFGEPARTAVLSAIREQVTYTAEVGDTTGARAAVGSASIGTLTLNGVAVGAGAGNPEAIAGALVAPFALQVLKTWGMLSSQWEPGE